MRENVVRTRVQRAQFRLQVAAAGQRDDRHVASLVRACGEGAHQGPVVQLDLRDDELRPPLPGHGGGLRRRPGRLDRELSVIQDQFDRTGKVGPVGQQQNPVGSTRGGFRSWIHGLPPRPDFIPIGGRRRADIKKT